MKILKIVLFSISVLVIALLVGLVVESPLAEEKSESVSSTCTFYVHITSSDDACLTGSYKYCINGGHSQPTSSDVIVVEVPCDRLYTICVDSGTCGGTIQLPANCPCPLSGVHVTLNLAPTYRPCNCAS